VKKQVPEQLKNYLNGLRIPKEKMKQK
jgi:hypothetical protein